MAIKGGADRRLGMWGWDMSQNAIGAGQGIIDAARNPALAALGEGRTQGLNALGQGYGQARDDLGEQFGSALGRLDPYVADGTWASGAYGDTLGRNGQEGFDRTYSSYQESPGVRIRKEQGTDAAMRAASAAGALGSGNTLAAVAKLVDDETAKGFDAYQTRLQGLADRGQQAATTQAGMQGQFGTALANLGQSQGRDTASLWSDTAGREAGVHTGLAGLGVNNLWQGTNAGIGSVMNGQKNAKDSVAGGYNLALGLGGAGLNLLGKGVGNNLFGGFGGGGLVPGTGGLINYGSGGGY